MLGVTTGLKADPNRRVLIMDEVDGMAGNEDRGGMQVKAAFFFFLCIAFPFRKCCLLVQSSSLSSRVVVLH